MSRLDEAIDERRGKGVRVSAWLHVEPVRSGGLSKRQLLRALGIRSDKTYPVQGRAKGEKLVVRAEAHYSPYEKQSRGALRSYLERPNAEPDVLQQAAFEYHLDRWSIWMNPSEHDVSPYVAVHTLTEELGERYGVAEEDVYIVQHFDKGSSDRWHLHAVVPGRPDMKIERAELRQIADKIARELVLERAVERALNPAREKPIESGWDLPATDAQMAVLKSHGRPGAELKRGDASLAIEAVTGERSFAPRERGR